MATDLLEFEVEAVQAQPPMPQETILFHVKLSDGSEFYLFRCSRDDDWHSILPLRGCAGGRLTDAERVDLRALPTIVSAAFPELCAGSAA
ncbi:hypothetical protein [Hypericibacter sp.]|uniref:hypothetical protein n=1 Tax=Hypericibacter sp. TaxID=2705401 RepID=UPI003D6CBA1C